MGSDIQREDDRKRSLRIARKERRTQVEWLAGFTLRLTESEQENIISDLEEEDMNVQQFLEVMGAEGIKTSISYDRKKDGYALTIYRKDPDYPDSGYSLTVHARNIPRCARALVFVLQEVGDFNIVEIASARESLESTF